MPETLPKEFHTINEAAERFKVAPKTIRNWISNGFITGYQLPGRLLRVDLNEIEAAITRVVAVTK